MIYKKWQKKEKKDAKDFEGRRVKGSGNWWSQPGDVKTKFFVIQSKQTDKKSYSIKLADWLKLCEEASFEGKLPVFSVDIQGQELVILGKDEFLNILKSKKS